MTYFIRDLARVIANIASMLNPEVVVIGGIVAQYMKPVLPDIRAVVGVLTPIPTRVELGSLGPWAAAMGAAFQWNDQMKSGSTRNPRKYISWDFLLGKWLHLDNTK